MELHKNGFYSFNYDSEAKILNFVWTESTEKMTDADFRDALSNFAGFAMEHRPANVLVDVRKFKHTLSAEVGTWRDEVVTPRYNTAGVKRFGYLLPKGAAPADDAPVDPPPAHEKFATRYFDSEEKAGRWFREG